MMLEYPRNNVKTYEAALNSVKAFPGKLDNGSVPGSPAGTSNGFVIVP